MAVPSKNYELLKNHNYLLDFQIFGSVVYNLQNSGNQFFYLKYSFCCSFETATQGSCTICPHPCYIPVVSKHVTSQTCDGQWPPHSPDLSTFDFFFGGNSKSTVYTNRPRQNTLRPLAKKMGKISAIPGEIMKQALRRNLSDPRENNAASTWKSLSKTGTEFKEWLKASQGYAFKKSGMQFSLHQ